MGQLAGFAAAGGLHRVRPSLGLTAAWSAGRDVSDAVREWFVTVSGVTGYGITDWSATARVRTGIHGPEAMWTVCRPGEAGDMPPFTWLIRNRRLQCSLRRKFAAPWCGRNPAGCRSRITGWQTCPGWWVSLTGFVPVACLRQGAFSSGSRGVASATRLPACNAGRGESGAMTAVAGAPEARAVAAPVRQGAVASAGGAGWSGAVASAVVPRETRQDAAAGAGTGQLPPAAPVPAREQASRRPCQSCRSGPAPGRRRASQGQRPASSVRSGVRLRFGPGKPGSGGTGRLVCSVRPWCGTVTSRWIPRRKPVLPAGGPRKTDAGDDREASGRARARPGRSGNGCRVPSGRRAGKPVASCPALFVCKRAGT
ncbi:hypothetical protein LHK_00031 [Laribacter hongkongensis HLHK9]|uniref:Uncharacterized protein n=1 Tax=Laribacter hongkongensis (strain HLHK9) TaxID=557598 RepID=C1D9C8_LARHH|nr:hypothetical protein LHK_00031 [Laribacter hongkongensis HLHK9]